MLNANSLTAHTFITGSTGSGKSTTVYKLLDELSVPIGSTNKPIKFLVIEPAKGEYKDHLATDKKFEIDVYGTNPDLTKLLRINPFRFRNDKIHIYEHLDRLTEIFNVCWPMYAAMPAVLKAAMENAYKEGKLRAIGVCNFYPARLTDLCETVEVIPAVNQVELHPFFQQEDALAVMQEYGVCPEAWGPFAEGNHGIFTHPVLTKIGEKYGKTAAQIALRWNIQRGVVVIPKSVHKDRIEENMDIWDFSLSDEDMGEIGKLDLGHSEIVDHDDPKFVQMLHGLKVHE